jgi:hypothetical protein
MYSEYTNFFINEGKWNKFSPEGYTNKIEVIAIYKLGSVICNLIKKSFPEDFLLK